MRIPSVQLPRGGLRDLALGFGLTSTVLLIALAVWPHSGVKGTISVPVCQYGPGQVQHCSIKPASASITVSAYLEGSWPGSSTAPSWQTRSDRAGHFHLDLPPGGYWLTTLADGAGFQGGTTFPVFAGQQTDVQLLLIRNIGLAQCLAADDLIDTPAGPVVVARLRQGMIVWTMDAAGHRVAAPVVRVSHTPAPPGHQVLRLRLDDGRIVSASPRHPTADGRQLGALRPGDLLDGSRLASVEEVAYVGDTWDILPAGRTGTYWANSVLLGSTLTSN